MAKTLSSGQIARAALVVLLGFMASGLLGLVRTAVYAATFGASPALDAFIAAQRIPELLFTLVAGGALGSSFIPVFSRQMATDPAKAWRLASAVLTLVTLIGAALAALMAAFAPLIVPALLVPGEPPAQQALTVSLTQIMLVTVVIFSVSGLIMGILNAQQMFTLPALAAALYNVGQIAGALILVPLLRAADPDRAVYGLAYGAVIGALLHLLIQLPGLPRAGAVGRLRVLIDARIDGVRAVLALMGPRVLGLAVVQINFVVNVALTSGMAAGSRTALTMAWTLMFFVLGVVAQSVGTALFPTLAGLAANGDMDRYKARLREALRGVLFLAFPAAVGLILLGAPLIQVLLQYGAWDAAATRATAWALAFYALGIAGHGLLEVLSRAFYALADTWTPVRVGILSIAANITLSLVLIRVIGDPSSAENGAFGGLALANSITTLLEAAALWLLLRRRIGGLGDPSVVGGALPALAAAVGMGAAIWLVQAAIRDAGALLTLIVGGTLGGVIFFALALIFRIDEARAIPLLILRRLRR
ncbi:MAG: murein biosynthesis integral membrane protein MurJ [bacterium]|nr:murein biosynthesis integral membrane protein MurJ [bacterium]